MPSKTPKQKKFMAAVANSPKFAKKVGVPQSIGKEFAAADKAKEDAEEWDGPGMQWDGIDDEPTSDDYDAELPTGHYDTHVRLRRGGRWNAHTVNVRKTDKELIKKFLDQGFRVVKPFEDNERYDDRDPVDDDALERARREDKLMGGIDVDHGGKLKSLKNIRKGMKDLDDKIKRMQSFKEFYNGK